MEDQLRNLLSPGDDGHGFTEAVLLRASGALARRRTAAENGSTWTWLERWARPWVLGAITALALLAVLPSIAPDPAGMAAAEEPAEVLLASPQQDVTMTVAWGR